MLSTVILETVSVSFILMLSIRELQLLERGPGSSFHSPPEERLLFCYSPMQDTGSDLLHSYFIGRKNIFRSFRFSCTHDLVAVEFGPQATSISRVTICLPDCVAANVTVPPLKFDAPGPCEIFCVTRVYYLAFEKSLFHPERRWRLLNGPRRSHVPKRPCPTGETGKTSHLV